MASLKTLFLVAVAISATILSANSTPVSEIVEKRSAKESHDLVVGARQTGDRIMHQEKIEEKYQWTGQKLIITRDVSVPYDHVITQVRALDQMTDGTGAEATITAGGPGMNTVSLRFKSQRWHGIYFNLEVYAKRRY